MCGSRLPFGMFSKVGVIFYLPFPLLTTLHLITTTTTTTTTATMKGLRLAAL